MMPNRTFYTTICVFSQRITEGYTLRKKKKTSALIKTLLWISVLSAILAAVSVCGSLWLIRSNIVPTLTVEAGTQSVTAKAFMRQDYGIYPTFAADVSAIDLNQPGDYPVRLQYFSQTYDSVLQVRDTTAPTASVTNLSVLSTQMPEPEAFLQNIRDISAVTVTYAQAPDPELAGDQTVTLLLTDAAGNRTQLQATLTVIVDAHAPVLTGVAPLSIFMGQEADYLSGVTIWDDRDENPVLTVDDSAVDLTREGTYTIVYTGVDFYGNQISESTTVTVIKDDTAPTLLGVNPLSLYAGNSIAYRKGILVSDDLDANPKLTVDSSQVDLSQPGVYEVTYTATDAAGNKTSITTTVTVVEKPDDYTDEATIYAAADALLAKIVTDDMTDREKVVAIYDWVAKNWRYAFDSDKSDWLQEAYRIITGGRGDCFSYYAGTRLLFDRLGIPNITVLRTEGARDSSHYWSMVSVDGGETYYHFDSTPRPSTIDGSKNFCLVTDAYLEAYEALSPNYYARDLSLYPATPEE